MIGLLVAVWRQRKIGCGEEVVEHELFLVIPFAVLRWRMENRLAVAEPN